ncbi:hypothetical protein, partial [Pseudomonas oryzihabitans]|uniref:hypothetical protein n=1 Tax=Pseudomonas oryzihabitans TaxID=47885 RepID=UPI00289A91C9
APHAEVPSGKGCAVFHATALIAAMGRSYRGAESVGAAHGRDWRFLAAADRHDRNQHYLYRVVSGFPGAQPNL